MATSYDIDVEQGVSFSLTITLRDDNSNPIDLGPYLVSGQVKSSYGSTECMMTFAPTILSAPSGQISLSFPATGTALLPIGLFPYNMFLVSGDYILNVLNGDFQVSPTVFAHC